jgi:AraC-like DNA-binding protein
MRDRPGAKTRPLDSILASYPLDSDGRLSYGGSGPRTRLVCGGFQLADGLPAGLVAFLPQIIRLDAVAVGLSRWLDPLFGLLRDEADNRQAGTSAVFAKLADVFLAQTLRSYLIGAQDAGLLQLTPLQDPMVSRAVDLLQSRSHERWTLADLAREVGTSRTALTTRFRELVGDTPISYLAKVRLTRAAGSLTTTDHNVGAVAHRSGYYSEASFSKAFKREFGMSPGQYRRHSRVSPILIDADV